MKAYRIEASIVGAAIHIEVKEHHIGSLVMRVDAEDETQSLENAIKILAEDLWTSQRAIENYYNPRSPDYSDASIMEWLSPSVRGNAIAIAAVEKAMREWKAVHP